MKLILINFVILLYLPISAQNTEKLNTDLSEFEQLIAPIQSYSYDEYFTLEEINRMIELCPDINQYPVLLLYKGCIFCEESKLNLAIKYFNLALEINKEKNLELEYNLLRNLMVVYAESKNYNKAEYYNNKAFDIAKKSKSKDDINDAIINIKKLNVELNKKDAIKDYLQFYNTLKVEKDTILKFETLLDLSEILINENKFTQASNILYKVEKDFDILKIVEVHRSDYYLDKSIVENELYNNYYNAKTYLDSTKQYLQNSNYIEEKIEMYRLYQSIYTNLKDFENLKITNDSLSFLNYTLTKEIQSTSINISEENILLEKLNKDLKHVNKTYKKKSLLFYTLIIILLVVTIYLFFLFYNKKRTLKYTKERFESLNKSYQKLFHSKKKDSEKLKALKKDLAQTDKNLAKDINIYLQEQDSFSELKLAPEIIEFKTENKLKYPKLNDNELLHLYYFNKNIKNKEVSEILGKSLKSVENVKYRIKRKTYKKEIINPKNRE